MKVEALWPPNLGPFVGFNHAWFRQMLALHGTECLWEKATPCPCRRVRAAGGLGEFRSKEHRSDCPACHGTGISYVEPQDIKAIVFGAGKNREFYQLYGSKAVGGARFVLFPEHVPSDLDRFTLTDPKSVITVDDEWRERKGDIDELTFPIATRVITPGTADAPQEPGDLVTVGVEYVRRAEPDGTVGPVMVDGVDFEVSDGMLHWLPGGDGPEVGSDYAVRYHANPVYIARRVLHPHRDTFAGMFQTPPVLTENPRTVDCWLLGYDPFPAAS